MVGSTAAAKVIPDARFARLELVSAREREKGDDDNDESANEAELAHRCTPACLSHTHTLSASLTQHASQSGNSISSGEFLFSFVSSSALGECVLNQQGSHSEMS